MRDLITDFRKFVMRGNLIDLAVAVIIGLYFKDLVDAFTNGIVLALVAAVFGEPNFQDITIGIGDSELLIGVFLNALINFLLVALVLFFVIKAFEMAKSRFRMDDETPPLTKGEELLTEIRDLLRSRA